MSTTYAKLRGRMVEKGVTQTELASYMGMSRQSISLRFRGIIGFTQEDIIKICDYLDISLSEIGLFFYATKVS